MYRVTTCWLRVLEVVTQIPSELCGPCQAFILLLAVLDIGKLMLIMREGRPLDAAAHRLGTASARASVNKELQTWGRPRAPLGGSPTMHAPLLLAWATFLCLSSSLTGDPGAVDPPCPPPLLVGTLHLWKSTVYPTSTNSRMFALSTGSEPAVAQSMVGGHSE